MKKHLLKIFLLVCCVVGGNVGALAETYSGTVSFAATSRITNNNDGTFTTASNTGNGYALALADLSSLANISSASSVTVSFTATIPSGSRLLLAVGDKATRGTTANGSNKSAYNTDGLIMRVGTTEGTYCRVNDGTNNSNAFGTSLKISLTLDRVNKKYSYTIVDAATGETTYFSGSDISTTVSNATVVEAYSWLNSLTFSISDVSYSYEYSASSFDYTIKAVDADGNEIKTLASGTSDGSAVDYYCPYAFKEGDNWYVKSSTTTYLAEATALSKDVTVEYTLASDVEYFGDWETAYSTTSGNYTIDTYPTMSTGQGRSVHRTDASMDLKFSVTGGIYSISIPAYNGNSSARNADIYVDDVKLTSGSVAYNTSYTYQGTIYLAEGEHTVKVMCTYNLTPTVDYLLVRKVSDYKIQGEQVGALDFSTAYYTTWNTTPVVINAGETGYYKFINHNNGGSTWENWYLFAANNNINLTVLRADNHVNDGDGTISSFPTTSDLVADLKDATVELKVSLVDAGDDTYTLTSVAEITKADGTKMSPNYVYTQTGFTVDNLNLFVSVEKNWLEVLEQGKMFNLTLNPDKTYTTYCNADKALDFTGNTDVAAYTAKYDSESGNVVLTQVSAVPAGAGVILKNLTKASSASVIAFASADALTDNELVGATSATSLTFADATKSGYYNYVLSNGKFHPVSDNTTLPAGKAYLSCAYNATASGAKALNIVFADDATAIKSVNNEQPSVSNKAAYNLTGQRVAANAKGIVIINGKKYLNK